MSTPLEWLRRYMASRGVEVPSGGELVRGAAMPFGLAEEGLDALGKGERAVLDAVGPHLQPETELGMRAAAVPFGAGRGQLEEYGGSPRGAAGMERGRRFFAHEPLGRGLDEIMGNEPGTFGTAAAMGLAQEGPVGLALGPVGAGSAAVRAGARPLAQAVAGRGGREMALRMGKAGLREAPVGAGVGAQMGAVQAEPGQRLEGGAMGAAIGGGGGFAAGAGGQGLQEVGRRAVTKRLAAASEKTRAAGFDPYESNITGTDYGKMSDALNEEIDASGAFVNWWDKASPPEFGSTQSGGRTVLPIKGGPPLNSAGLDDVQAYISAKQLSDSAFFDAASMEKFSKEYNKAGRAGAWLMAQKSDLGAGVPHDFSEIPPWLRGSPSATNPETPRAIALSKGRKP